MDIVQKTVSKALADLVDESIAKDLFEVTQKLTKIRARYAAQYEKYAFDDGDDLRADLLDEMEYLIEELERRKRNLEDQQAERARNRISDD